MNYMQFEKYHRLKIVKKTNKRNSDNRILYEMICDCGNKVLLPMKVVKSGNTKSCGCLKKEKSRISVLKVQHLAAKAASIANKKHGFHGTRFYNIWLGFRWRCDGKIKNYGGRGITYDKRWKEFVEFKNDMYDSYLEHCQKFGEKQTTIERKNVDKGYCKSNCCWATHFKQCRNKRTNVFIEFNGKKKTIGDWSKFIGGNSNLVSDRLKMGWSIERALTERVA